MKRIIATAMTTAVIAAGGIAAPPANAYLTSDAREVKRMLVGAWRSMSYTEQDLICDVWRTKPVKTGKRFTRVAMRKGYSMDDAARGVVAGFYKVCGAPYGY